MASPRAPSDSDRVVTGKQAKTLQASSEAASAEDVIDARRETLWKKEKGFCENVAKVDEVTDQSALVAKARKQKMVKHRGRQQR